MKDARIKQLMDGYGRPNDTQLMILIQQVANEVAQAVHAEYTEKAEPGLTTKDEIQIALFEDYIDALADRRIFHDRFPDSPDNFENRVVDEAKKAFLLEMFP